MTLNAFSELEYDYKPPFPFVSWKQMTSFPERHAGTPHPHTTSSHATMGRQKPAALSRRARATTTTSEAYFHLFWATIPLFATSRCALAARFAVLWLALVPFSVAQARLTDWSGQLVRRPSPPELCSVCQRRFLSRVYVHVPRLETPPHASFPNSVPLPRDCRRRLYALTSDEVVSSRSRDRVNSSVDRARAFRSSARIILFLPVA